MPIRQTEDGNFVLTVNGEEKTLTPDELEVEVNKVQKEFAANAKFEEAAKLKKEAETAAQAQVAQAESKVKEWINKSNEGDMGSYSLLLDFLGVEEADKQTKLTSFKELWEEVRREDAQNARDTSAGDKGEKPFELPEDLKKELDELKEWKQQYYQEQVEKTRGEIFSETLSALAKDSLVGKIVESGGPLAEKLQGLAKDQVKSRIRDGDQYSPELVAQVVKDISELTKELGTSRGAPTSTPGLGEAPSIALTEAQAQKPVEPKSITEQDYGENATLRMAQFMREGTGG